MKFLRNPGGGSFSDEPDLMQRIETLSRSFEKIFGVEAALCVRSPGRAEILGNHTDYNNGYALSAAISKSIIGLFRKRDDRVINIASDAFGNQVVSFSLDSINKEQNSAWVNYVRGVAYELLEEGKQIGGADILLGANLPTSGGVSSSAALELCIAWGLLSIYDLSSDKLSTALLCKRAENGSLVGTPCGLLDQASVAMGERGKAILLDFHPSDGGPLGVRLIPASLSEKGYSFVISVDPDVKRNLGETGYPARRKMCESSTPILSELLEKKVSSLRDVSVSEYESVKEKLSKTGGDIMRMRVEHIVYENERVLNGVSALEKGDVELFGNLLNEAGVSALELYGLDEKTPELSFLVQTQREFQGISGTRNMGGGFSAITLSLLKKDLVPGFINSVGASYKAKWGRDLEFIEFSSTQGVEIL